MGRMAAPGPDRAQRPPLLRFGTFELDLLTQELRRAGALIKIQSQHFQLLALLVEHSGQVVSREEIRETLWGDQTFVDSSGASISAPIRSGERWTTIRTILAKSKRCPAKATASLRQ